MREEREILKKKETDDIIIFLTIYILDTVCLPELRIIANKLKKNSLNILNRTLFKSKEACERKSVILN